MWRKLNCLGNVGHLPPFQKLFRGRYKADGSDKKSSVISRVKTHGCKLSGRILKILPLVLILKTNGCKQWTASPSSQSFIITEMFGMQTFRHDSENPSIGTS